MTPDTISDAVIAKMGHERPWELSKVENHKFHINSR